jgi:protein TonB
MKQFFPMAGILAIAIPAVLAAQNRAPRLVTKVEPECTAAASEAKTHGTVVVTVTIDHNGTPRNIRVVRGLDFGLSGKAVEAVEQWRFEPGTKDGRPAAIDATIEVNFRCPG